MSLSSLVDIVLAVMAIVVMAMVAMGNKFPRIKLISFTPEAGVTSRRPLRATTAPLASLTLCGLASGLLSSYLTPHEQWWVYPGIVFGVFLSVCLLLLGKLRSRWWFPVFPMVSGVAYFHAIWSAFIPDVLMRVLGKAADESSRLDLHAPVRFFIAGFTGAAIFFIAGIWPFLLRGARFKRTAKFGLFWCIAGGVLGMIGWTSGSSLGGWLCSVMHPNDCDSMKALNDRFYSLYPIWQTGMAFVLGTMLWADQKYVQQRASA